MTQSQGAEKTVSKKAQADADIRPYQKIIDGLSLRAKSDAGTANAFDVASRVMDAMAEAGSWDDIVAAQSGVGDIGSFINTPINVTDVAFMRSDEKYRQGGLGYYVYVEGHTDNGEPFSLTTGGTNVVAAFYLAQTKLGIISADKPLRCKILSRETANGTLYTVGKA